MKILSFLLILGLITSTAVDGSRPMHMKNKNGKKGKCSLLKIASMLEVKFRRIRISYFFGKNWLLTLKKEE